MFLITSLKVNTHTLKNNNRKKEDYTEKNEDTV